MGALWMLGYEDAPERSAEICVFEVFGRWVRPDRADVVMGGAPVRRPADHRRVRPPSTEPVTTVHQSSDYPMQFVLDVYALPGLDRAPSAGPWPEELVVDWFRGYRPAGTPPRRP